jgi:hypothetical protein
MSQYDAMRIPIASDGRFGIAVQSVKGTPVSDAAKYRYFQYTSSPFGMNQPTTQLPQIAGGKIIPAGLYKSGIWGAGALNLVPFLDNNFGYLLLAALGQDDVTLDYRMDPAGGADVSAAGVNLHTFTYKDVQSDIPYLSTRKLIQFTTPLGEQTQDGRVNNLEMSLPGNGVMTATIDMLSRVPGDAAATFTDDPFGTGTTTGAGDWDDVAVPNYDSTTAYGLASDPLSCVRLNDTSLPCSGLVVTMANNLLPADRGRVIGSPTPVDYPVLSRSINLRATVFMASYDLYKDIFAGGHAHTDRGWSTSIVSGDLDFIAYAPMLVGATAVQHAIQVRTTGANVDWAVQGQIAQQAGEPLIITLNGTLRMPDEDSDPYVEVRLQNGETAEYAA